MAPHQGADSIVAVSQDGDHHPRTDIPFQTAKRSGKAFDIVDDAAITAEGLSREEALTALTTDEEKKLIRRVDWRLVPLLCMLYMVKKLDESNVSPGTAAMIETPLLILGRSPTPAS